jgi:uncharacterized RDD family membrane protein YckC
MHMPMYAVPVAPDGRPLAGAGQRLGARLIDTVVYLIAAMVSAGVILGTAAALLNSLVDEDSPVVPVTAITMIVLIIVGLQYAFEVEIPLRWNGQTPGKRLLKIAVIAMEPHVPLTRGRLTYRYLVMLGCNLLSYCYVGLLDPLWCLWDKPYRQCLHDKPAKTVVIRLGSA